jgi:hypothetical protein
MKTNRFDRQASFTSLCAHYRKAPIVLYVGAGISVSRDPAYGLPDWVGLLNKLANKITGVRPPDLPAHPWDAADRILELCVDHLKGTRREGENLEEEAVHRLQNALWEMIRCPENCVTHGKKHPFKLLNKAYLQNALTLRTVAAFCARPIGRSHNSEVYRFGANHRVRAVLSGNYDPYLESAATSMFKIPVVKPVAAFGSLAGGLREVPVHHVHGYVPHPGQKETGDYKPMLEQLVLTRRSYEQAWRAHDVFCATMIPQIYLLRHYITLFVGFSFTDAKITQLLEKVWQEYPVAKQKERWNYAIVRKGVNPRQQAAELERLGVRPIFVMAYDDIPALLGAVYAAGLKDDYPYGQLELPLYEGRKMQPSLEKHSLPCAKIWEMLYTCHQCHPGVLGAS